MEIKKGNLLIAILIILLALAMGYIINDQLKERRIVREQEVYNLGVQETISAIMKQASSCEQISLYNESSTLNLIAVECLQQQELTG